MNTSRTSCLFALSAALLAAGCREEATAPVFECEGAAVHHNGGVSTLSLPNQPTRYFGNVEEAKAEAEEFCNAGPG
ncbi:MAG TPA: hypothetical protein PLO23_06715 [Alphaproteobacteria bacterium]|nr:hypothetical protein [Alphaproteobacteria bacterium]